VPPPYNVIAQTLQEFPMLTLAWFVAVLVGALARVD
jgi:hypothetical protein